MGASLRVGTMVVLERGKNASPTLTSASLAQCAQQSLNRKSFRSHDNGGRDRFYTQLKNRGEYKLRSGL